MAVDLTLTDADKALIAKVERDAFSLQLKYRVCSQTCLLALQENLGFGDVLTFKAASSMHTGIAAMGTGCCGALLGGIMALGIEFGRAAIEEAGAPRGGGMSNLARSSMLAVELYTKFKNHWQGNVNCWDIQDLFYEKEKLHPEMPTGKHYDSNHPDSLPYKMSGEFFDILSPKAAVVVQVAARLTAEIIIRERKVDADRGKHYY